MAGGDRLGKRLRERGAQTGMSAPPGGVEALAGTPQAAVQVERLRSVVQRDDIWSTTTPGKPETIFRILRDARTGDTADYVRASEDSEEKEAEIRQSLETRVDAVLACPTTITPADDSDRAAEITEGIRDIWEGIPAKREAMSDMLSGGLTVGFDLEQIRLSDEPVKGLWRVEAFEEIERRALVWRDADGVLDFPRLRLKGQYEAYGISLDDYRPTLILHQRRKGGSCLRGGLMRTLLWYSLFSRFNLKDWISFNERYGDPLLTGKYPSGAQKQERDDLLKALKSLGTDARAIISENTKIETLETNKIASVQAFERFGKKVDEAIVKVVLGQTKTSMGEGGSFALAKVHQEVLGTKTAADCGAMSETLNDQLISRLVLWNWGPGALDLAPKITFDFIDPAQRALEANSLKTAVEIGVPVPVGHARRVLGIPEPEEDEEVLEPLGGGQEGPFGAAQRKIEGEPWQR